MSFEKDFATAAALLAQRAKNPDVSTPDLIDAIKVLTPYVNILLKNSKTETGLSSEPTFRDFQTELENASLPEKPNGGTPVQGG